MSKTNQELEDELAAAMAQITAQREQLRIKDLEAAALTHQLRVKDLKSSGDYWSTFDQVWEFEAASYKGCFLNARGFRQAEPCCLYTEMVMDILTDGRSVEAVLKDDDAPSLFEKDVENSVSTASFGNNRSNRKGDKNNEKEHAKNILGYTIENFEKSRAHTFPADEACYKWWWPMYELVTGTRNQEYDPSAISKLSSMRTCKIVFAGEHNHLYDSLRNGQVCTIPIFESMKKMARWQYKDGYRMLIIADSPRSYWGLRVGDESLYEHIKIASQTEIANATKLLAQMMQVMADSLVSNWEGHYKNKVEDDGERRKMLKDIRDMLVAADTVDIPTFTNQDGQDPKLYLIDYDILYKDDPEGKNYIPDPFPALIKSAVNLSHVTIKAKYQKYEGYKFLPGWEEESVHSVDILGLVDHGEKSAPETSFQELIDKEIELHFVSDDEFDDDEDDITQ